MDVACTRQGLHIPVEINHDDLARLVHERASGVSADGVRGRYEVHRSIEMEFAFGSHPALRQPVGRWFPCSAACW